MYGLLKNIVTESTDCKSLVLVARCIWPDTENEVFGFVCQCYPENRLSDQNKFKEVWETGKEHMPYVKRDLLQFIHVGIFAHASIQSYLPTIMQSPIFSISQRDYTKLQFTPDTPPLFSIEAGSNSVARTSFQLEYDTGKIIGCNKQGEVHKMYGINVRPYFKEGCGVKRMANLLHDENIGSMMRYDNSVEGWRLYRAETGIWTIPTVNEDVGMAGNFLGNPLLPIASLEDFVGPAQFDWVSGEREPMPELEPEDVDCDGEDAGLNKKKRLCKSSPAGEHSLRKLNNAIATFFDTPKHMAEVMEVLKFLSHAIFEKTTEINSEEQQSEKNSQVYKHVRIRSVVSSGLHRMGCVKDAKTLKYLGAASFDIVVDHIQAKMDCYNIQHVGKKQMSFANIKLDHIKPVQRFALEMSHYKNVQPLFKEINRSKSAKWTDIDETFWRANIQHQHDFTDIYTGTALNPSETLTQNTQLKEPDVFLTRTHTYTHTHEVPLSSSSLSSSGFSPKQQDSIAYAINTQQVVQSLDKNEVVQQYAMEHLCISAGKKTSLKAITQHFRDTTKIESITLKDKLFAALLRTATPEMGPEWIE